MAGPIGRTTNARDHDFDRRQPLCLIRPLAAGDGIYVRLYVGSQVIGEGDVASVEEGHLIARAKEILAERAPTYFLKVDMQFYAPDH